MFFNGATALGAIVAAPALIPNHHNRIVLPSIDDIVAEFVEDLHARQAPGMLYAADYVEVVQLRKPVAAALSLSQHYGIPLNRFSRTMDAEQKEKCPFPESADKAADAPSQAAQALARCC
jgi:hypothetical protein